MTVKELLVSCDKEKLLNNVINRTINSDSSYEDYDPDKKREVKEKLKKRYGDLTNILINKSSNFCPEKVVCSVKIKNDGKEAFDVFMVEKKYATDKDTFFRNSFALDLVDWNEILGYDICQKSINSYGNEQVAASILYEITFYGFDEETVTKKKKELEDKLQQGLKEMDGKKAMSWDEFLINMANYCNMPSEEFKKDMCLSDEEEKVYIEETKQNKKISNEFMLFQYNVFNNLDV